MGDAGATGCVGPAQRRSSCYRIVVAVVGLAILAVGIVAIPYPGPGWAIVFVGLGILATEFDWARRLLAYAKERYDTVMDWFRRQGRWVQVLGVACYGAGRRWRRCGCSARWTGRPSSSASSILVEEPYRGRGSDRPHR